MDDLSILEKVLLMVVGGLLAIILHDLFSMGDEKDFLDRLERWLKR